MSSLAEREKQLLLQIARSALTLGVANKPPLRDFPTEVFLQQPAGAFVTLHLRGRLRGCVGQLPGRPPHAAVADAGGGAPAPADSRFEPFTSAELSEVDIEDGGLSALEQVTPQAIPPGKHGLS